jgi:hypothetical protein
MTTAFLGLAQSVAAVLAAVPAHAGVRVYVNRRRPVGVAETRAIFVRLDGTRRNTDSPLGAQDWQTQIQVEVAARGPTGEDPAQAVDALLESCWSALLSVPLGLPDVIDLDAEPAIDWDEDAADTPIGTATFSLLVRHRTKALTLTPWSA